MNPLHFSLAVRGISRQRVPPHAQRRHHVPDRLGGEISAFFAKIR
jgi:hypothetical protein